MVLRPALCLCLAAVVSAVPEVYGDVGFWPGDAFFHFSLTETTLEGMSDHGIRLDYFQMPPGGAYDGFRHLVITGDTASLHRRLRKVLALNSERPAAVRHGFDALVYNVNVKWSTKHRRIGMKYNESWAEVPAQYLDPASKQPRLSRASLHHYHALINSPAAIIHDWQFAREVDGLAVEVPRDGGWGIAGRSIDVPLSIDARDVQIVVVTQSDLGPVFEQRNDAQFYTISNQRLRLSQFRDGTVVYRELDPEEDTADSWGPESHGLRTRLLPTQNEFVVGQPATFQLEMKNVGPDLIRYDAQGIDVNNSMQIIDADGKHVRYVWGPVSTGTGLKSPALGPDEATVLLDDYDLCEQYLVTAPGSYSVQCRPEGAIPCSNVVKFELRPGSLPLSLKVPARLIGILPGNWEIQLNSRVSLVNDGNVTPFGWQSGVGTYVAIVSTTSNKKDYWAVDVWVTEHKLALASTLPPGGPAGHDDAATYLGKGVDGHVYWRLPVRAEAEWPEIQIKVKSSLQIAPE